MFVALRELRFARGRFILIGSVVGLITILVGFLSGLTGGLANQNISAIMSIPADRLVFSAPGSGAEASFADSAVSEQQAAAWREVSGVTRVDPIGIAQTSASAANSAMGNGEAKASATAIALFGVPSGFNADAPSRDGAVGMSVAAADSLGVAAGDRVTINGTTYTVDTISGDDWYSHTPVVEMTLHDWQARAAATDDPGAYAAVLAVTGTPDWHTAEAATQTVSQSTLGSLTALSSFRSEIGSLLLMIVMLFGISGLVIGAFFTVWTMQRKSDIAVLKALGASTRSLVRDALGQAVIVTIAGIGVGLGVVALLGAAAGTAVPFLLSPVTTVLPGVIMIVLGLAGTAFALRSVTAADPLTALGSNR